MPRKSTCFVVSSRELAVGDELQEAKKADVPGREWI